jgi:hypothetical protein
MALVDVQARAWSALCYAASLRRWSMVLFGSAMANLYVNPSAAQTTSDTDWILACPPGVTRAVDVVHTLVSDLLADANAFMGVDAGTGTTAGTFAGTTPRTTAVTPTMPASFATSRRHCPTTPPVWVQGKSVHHDVEGTAVTVKLQVYGQPLADVTLIPHEVACKLARQFPRVDVRVHVRSGECVGDGSGNGNGTMVLVSGASLRELVYRMVAITMVLQASMGFVPILWPMPGVEPILVDLLRRACNLSAIQALVRGY